MRKCCIVVILAIIALFLGTVAAADTEYQYAEVITQQGPLNMRKTDSSKSAIIEKIPNHTIIPVTSIDGDWCRCVYLGAEGYVMTKYLTLIDMLPFRALSRSDSGRDVLELKERLRELNFYGADTELNDYYGIDTETCVKMLQSAQGMEATGIASPELQAFIFWGPAEKNISQMPLVADHASGNGSAEAAISAQTLPPSSAPTPTPAPTPAAVTTKTMTVTISSSCSGYNHVGNSWSQYYRINDTKVVSKDKVAVTLGDSVSVYTRITENDKSPDVGTASDKITITQDFFENGFSVTQKISVKEDKGRYSGNKAVWTVTYKFTP